MNSKKTVVILAGGLGSRYKGLKQIDGILDNGATIMEYSIYDALEAGFNTFVIVINPFIPEEFKQKIEQILSERKAELVWVHQHISDFVNDESMYENRQKPWGTAHAVLCAGKSAKGNFVIINADDFYGKEIYKTASKLIDEGKIDENHGAQIAFPVGKTVSDSGTVSRGICHLNQQNELVSIEEQTTIKKQNDKIVFECGGSLKELDENTLVSMNFWILNESVFKEFERIFQVFLNAKPSQTTEFQLPTVIHQLIKEEKLAVTVKKSPSSWKGVTYPEDKEWLKVFLQREIQNKRYPENLWN